MKASQIQFKTLRESPAEAVIDSHKLMLRADLIRKLGNGLYAYMPLGLRAYRKVERIIKEEIEAGGACEFKPTVVVPGDIWKESGRWDAMGPQMLKAKNRSEQDMVVSPTAEEAFTALARQGLSSYKQLPVNWYQVNTKYRDEIRPRYGVMRSREFNMMDGYTLNATDESLDASYRAYAASYMRIFARLGLPVIRVRADEGAMGGSASEEFMVESDVGDDTLILCDCGYAANVEKAECKQEEAEASAEQRPLEKINTPGVGTIDDLEALLHCSKRQLLKTLIYKASNVCLDVSTADTSKSPAAPAGINCYPELFVAVCIRGDLDVNEAKLASFLKASEVTLATAGEDERITGAAVGFAGPVDLTGVPILADQSVPLMRDFLVGANETGRHYLHAEYGRDFSAWRVADFRVVKAGDVCCECGRAMRSSKGCELGHIFKLGKKYTESMGVTFLDEEGVNRVPTMGSYGIGVDRVLAAVVEQSHDERGIIWPVTAAPYCVEIVPIRYEGQMKEVADKLHEELCCAGVDVLLDDREERPGVKFADADLVGFPVRITVGERNLPRVELKHRRDESPVLVDWQKAAHKVQDMLAAEAATLKSSGGHCDGA